MKISISLLMLVISSIPKRTRSRDIEFDDRNNLLKYHLAMTINKPIYYLYQVEKCVEKEYYSVKITSSKGVWCTNNLDLSRMHSVAPILNSVNCSSQYFEMIGDIQLVSQCNGSIAFAEIVGLIDGTTMKPGPRYLDNAKITRPIELRDLVHDIIQQKERKEINSINSEILKKIGNTITYSKSAWIISIVTCSLNGLVTTVIAIMILFAKLKGSVEESTKEN
ncbi:hypothetical protein SNEBB_003822, partial [Seison nebaliae]